MLIPTEDNIVSAARMIKNGMVVGMPTETVYGLAANAFDADAVERIFIAKGRPQDNPLIVHINSLDMLNRVTREVSPVAERLAERFWPGPLTMIFKKGEEIPPVVTAGLDTVGIRYPSNKVAQALIREAGVPLAAPSANRSGSPSPTTANHVYTDLNGKIPAVLDGGACEVGLESTVILLDGNDKLTILRPGAVTAAMLRQTVPHVEIDHGVLNEVKEGEKALSPGMLHRHYSPKANVILLDCDFPRFKKFIEQHADEDIGAMVFDHEDTELDVPCVTYGAQDDPVIQAKLLFSTLRDIDSLGVRIVYARMPEKNGMGLAIYNRLIRAAGFEVISL